METEFFFAQTSVLLQFLVLDGLSSMFLYLANFMTYDGWGILSPHLKVAMVEKHQLSVNNFTKLLRLLWETV